MHPRGGGQLEVLDGAQWPVAADALGDEGFHIGAGAVLGGVIVTAVGAFVVKKLGALEQLAAFSVLARWVDR